MYTDSGYLYDGIEYPTVDEADEAKFDSGDDDTELE